MRPFGWLRVRRLVRDHADRVWGVGVDSWLIDMNRTPSPDADNYRAQQELFGLLAVAALKDQR